MTDVSVALRPPWWCPSEGHQHGVSIQSSINLGETLFRITREWKAAQTLILARLFFYQSSIIYLILDLIYWIVAIFIFDANHQYKSNPHRGWVFDLILSILSMEVTVAVPYRSYFETLFDGICQRSCLTGASFLSKFLWVWDVDWEGSLLIFPYFLINRQQPASDMFCTAQLGKQPSKKVTV